jgi:hypothetical protein
VAWRLAKPSRPFEQGLSFRPGDFGTAAHIGRIAAQDGDHASENLDMPGLLVEFAEPIHHVRVADLRTC